MATLTAIVDDRDPSIKYAGNWDQTAASGVTEEFQGTTSQALDNTSTATFSFSGTGIGAYATIGPNFGTAQFGFIMDGVPQNTFIPTTSTIASRHFPVFLSTSFNNGPHTLIITRSGGTDPTLFLDYFLYNTSSASVLPNTVYFFDDSSPLIQYDNNWSRSKPTTGFAMPFQNTTTSVGNKGGSFSFPFEGSGISIFGQLPNVENPTDPSQSEITAALVSIDGTSVASPNLLPNAINGPLSNALIYNSSVLKEGNHTLSVQVPGGNTFTLDYILVQTSNFSPSQSSNSSQSGTSGSQTSDFPPSQTSNGSQSGTPEPQTSDASANSSSNQSNAGAIAGGVVGGVAVILMVVACILLFRRRRRTNQKSSAMIEIEMPDDQQQRRRRQMYEPFVGVDATSQPTPAHTQNQFPTSGYPQSQYPASTSPPSSSNHTSRAHPQAQPPYPGGYGQSYPSDSKRPPRFTLVGEPRSEGSTSMSGTEVTNIIAEAQNARDSLDGEAIPPPVYTR